MKYLFNNDSLRILESFCFAPTLFAFDFDVTLAPIVRDPAKAYPLYKTLPLIIRLCRSSPVAVVSGRSYRDISTRLGFRPRFLVGNHGLESSGSTHLLLTSARKVTRHWKESLSSRLRAFQGVEIEDKEFSLAMHYRKARAKAFTRLGLLDACSSLSPAPRIIMGKCVINLLPVGAPHKGTALLDLMVEAGVKAAFYIGDDDTDEDVFSLPGARLFSVRVGESRISSAGYFIRKQSEIDELLRRLIAYVEGNKERSGLEIGYSS